MLKSSTLNIYLKSRCKNFCIAHPTAFHLTDFPTTSSTLEKVAVECRILRFFQKPSPLIEPKQLARKYDRDATKLTFKIEEKRVVC
jgi:hypothetical protein